MTSIGVMASAVNISGGPCTDLLMEPFNNLSNWTSSGLSTITTAPGRTGTAASITNSDTRNLTYAIPTISQDATLTVGFAYRTNTSGNVVDVCQFFSDSNVTLHNRLQVGSAGAVQVTRGATVLGVSANGLVPNNTWVYLEVQITLHDTAGIATVRVNGTVVLTLTSQDTKNAGTKTVYDSFRVSGPLSTLTNLFDDLYISAGSGCAFKGDITIP